MRFSTVFAALVLPAASVVADLKVVTVGANGQLAFNPPSITAKEGDTIAFQLYVRPSIVLINLRYNADII